MRSGTRCSRPTTWKGASACRGGHWGGSNTTWPARRRGGAGDRQAQRRRQELIRTIDAQRRLDRKTGTGTTGQTAAPGRGTGPGAGAAGTGGADQNANATQPGGKEKGGNGLVPPLSPDEINRVRLLEWHGDRNVRVRLQNDVKHRYVSHSGVRPAEFNKMDAVDQALIIKKHGTPDMWNDIRIANDPPALQEYRTLIQHLLTSCATAACHGGGAGSDRFALHAKADHEPEAYANFITLNKFHYKPAKGREAEMIDRNRPEDSLLVQFGLPFDLANTPHPDVEGFRPAFRTKNDPKLRQVVHWIADSLSPLQSNYGVPFDTQAEPASPTKAPSRPAVPTRRARRHQSPARRRCSAAVRAPAEAGRRVAWASDVTVP